MRTLGFSGERVCDLVDYLLNSHGKQGAVIREIDGKKVGFFVQEKYFLRASAAATCSIFYLQPEKDACEIDIVVTGGYSGILGIDLGSRNAMESETGKSITKYAVENLELRQTEDDTDEKIKIPSRDTLFPYWRY
jgi:hypothetical protein